MDRLTTPIRDRITELRRVKASDLLANPRNWRTHPAGQSAALSAVLQEVGYADALLARETPHGLELIDGHLRQKLTPDQEVPVLILDVTEDEANKILLTLDPLASLAESDKQALDALLRDVTTGDAALQEMLSDLAKDNGLTYGSQEPATAPEPEIDRAEELQKKWKVQLGDMWQIGRHWLKCGDSTAAKDVEELLDGQRTQLILTSPPYGVGMDYEGSDFESTCDLVRAVLSLAADSVIDNGFAFVNFGDRWTFPKPMSAVYVDLFSGLGWRWYDFRFWQRDCVSLAIWNTTQPHAMSSVEVLYTFQKGTAGYPVHDLSISKEPIWQAPGSSAGKGHQAVMATGIALKAITIYTTAGDTIHDPFAGTGTTICAAETLGRTCYGMEIEPKYVAVTLERLSQMNLEPKLIEQGVPAKA